MLAEEEFQKLDQIAAYNQKVDPCKYCLIMAFAIFALFLSIWYIVFTFMNVALLVNGRTVNDFMDGYLVYIENTPVKFISTLLLIFTGYYLVLAAFKGNVKVGLRFFIVSFYPLVPRETFVNSFMANCLVMNLWMVSLTSFMTMLFKSYLVGTHIARIFSVLVNNMLFFGWMMKKNFWTTFMISMYFISLIYFILKPFEKINLGNNVKRADLAAKH